MLRKKSLLFVAFVCLQSSCGPSAAPDEYDLDSIGVVVSRDRYTTHWRIPLAHMHEVDKRLAFEGMIKEYQMQIKSLRERFLGQSEDPNAQLPIEDPEFQAELEQGIRRILNSQVQHPINEDMADHYDELRSMSSWRSYFIPQAFIIFGGARFGGGAGISGGFRATIFHVVQPWLELSLDNLTGKQITKQWKFLGAMLGIPNVSIGMGAGAGASILGGLGAVYGPLEHPSDLAGLGLGASIGGNIPISGGFGQVNVILRNPPLYYYTIGFKAGASVEFQVEGEAQVLLDIETFEKIIEGMVRQEARPKGLDQ